ncbi:cell division cycle 123 [Lamellibrachia satsuma]|nr:cell division cycle 123 [Lamellibrachia satsuma]
MKTQHVLNCQFSSWYNQFKETTIKSHIIDLPQEFIDYLHADGLVLPDSCEETFDRTDFEGDSDDEVAWDNDTRVAKAPSFPQFEGQLKSAITKLGGKVFPKLNWSSPKDAAWIIHDNTLRCTCPRDIYLLLKSSDFVTHDLTQPFDQCDDHTDGDQLTVGYQLILRQWHSVHPGLEFRCFVKNNKLIGICQRHHSSFYSFISTDKEDIITDIKTFYWDKINERFPDCDYVFDVYRKKKEKVYLVDFNPFGSVTDSLLFDWQELKTNTNTASENPVFRYVQDELGVQPAPYHTSGVPQDFIHLASGEDPYKLVDLLKLKIQQQNEDDNSSD